MDQVEQAFVRVNLEKGPPPPKPKKKKAGLVGCQKPTSTRLQSDRSCQQENWPSRVQVHPLNSHKIKNGTIAQMLQGHSMGTV